MKILPFLTGALGVIAGSRSCVRGWFRVYWGCQRGSCAFCCCAMALASDSRRRSRKDANGGCDHTTHYMSSEGFCCELCQAGTSKEMDCVVSMSQSFCRSCNLEKDFMDELTSSSACKKCSSCDSEYETIVRGCTTETNTVCRCKDGLQRVDPSDPCTVTKEVAGNIGVVAGVVAVVALLVVVAVVLVLYRLRKGRCPWGNPLRRHPSQEAASIQALPLIESGNNDGVTSAAEFINKMIVQGQEGNWSQIEDKLPELRDWIGRTPSLYLHQLKRQNVITEQRYWEAFTTDEPTTRADSILLPIMRLGSDECEKLLVLLDQQQKREQNFLGMLSEVRVCSPSLNPNSANPHLKVSADLSTVEWTQEAQPYPDDAARFEREPIVLCFESFSSGVHYWEVDLRTSYHCSVGVVHESIPRGFKDKSSRLGWNEMSWAFNKWDSKYYARHDQQHELIKDIKHVKRVGVHLHCDEGNISFYDAVTMERLYSFENISHRPLCPALQVNSGSVTIYDAQLLHKLTADERREDILICDHFINDGVHRMDKTYAAVGDGDETYPAIQEVIGRIPAMLYHELLVQDLVTHSELSNVYSMSHASQRADFIISCVAGKEMEKLHEILRGHREKQEDFLEMRCSSRNCSPTLNQSTAHPELHISADFKIVRTFEDAKPYPDHPGRFELYHMVICSDNFSSGRHYWEVDLGNSDKCVVGVTYETIQRKGEERVCKIGCNDVSWGIKKLFNAYTALHGSEEKILIVRDAPRKVGVHLDWEAGTLSFYSADSMALLHRFHAEFDQPLYPVIAVLHGSLSIQLQS